MHSLWNNIKKFFTIPPVEESYWRVEYYGLCGRRIIYDVDAAIKAGKYDRQLQAVKELSRRLKQKSPSV